MSVVLTAPERLALMLKDCDERVTAAYPLYVTDIDFDFLRPAWIVTAGEASYALNSETSVSQASIDEDYELTYVGHIATGTEQDWNSYYERVAREIANNAVVYLLRAPNLQFPNLRGLADNALPPLNGVLWSRPQRRSQITLMTRESLEQPFWGFSISLSVRSMLSVDEDEFIVTG